MHNKLVLEDFQSNYCSKYVIPYVTVNSTQNIALYKLKKEF